MEALFSFEDTFSMKFISMKFISMKFISMKFIFTL